MDDLVERLNAGTLADLYEHCREGADRDGVAEQLRAFGSLFIDFVQKHANERDAVMSYRFGEGHTTSDEYDQEILRLFGLTENAPRQFYDEEEQEEHSADMAILWASLTSILGVASSERKFGGMSLEQMLNRLIRMVLKARS